MQAVSQTQLQALAELVELVAMSVTAEQLLQVIQEAHAVRLLRLEVLAE